MGSEGLSAWKYASWQDFGSLHEESKRSFDVCNSEGYHQSADFPSSEELVEYQDLTPPQPSNSTVSSAAWQLGYLALFTCQVINATYATTAKKAINNDVDLIVFTFYRIYLSAPLFFLADFCSSNEVRRIPSRQELLRIAAAGLTGILGNKFLFACTLLYLDPTSAAVTVQTQGAIALLIGVALGVESLQILKVIGILLSFGGVIIVTLGPDWYSGHSETRGINLFYGVTLGVLSAACMSVYHQILKPLTAVFPVAQLMTYAYIVSCFFMGLVALSKVGCSYEAWILDNDGILAVSVAVIANSFLKYNLLAYAVERVSVVEVTAWNSISAPLTSVFAYFILGDLPTWWFSGFVVVILGVCIIAYVKQVQKQ